MSELNKFGQWRLRLEFVFLWQRLKKLIGRKTKLGRPAPAHRSNLRGGINYGSILIFLKFNIDLDFEKVMKVMKAMKIHKKS